MKESLFCSNMIMKLDFKELFESAPVYIDNTSAFHVVGRNTTFSPRAKHIIIRHCYSAGAREGRKSHHTLCEDGASIRGSRNKASQ